MNKSVICVSLFLLTPAVWACSYVPAAVAFVVINDKDGDKALNEQEWLNAHTDGNFVMDFPLNRVDEFTVFDRDDNGKVNAPEIGFERIHYQRNPCERYQSRVRARLQGQDNMRIYVSH